ncbi:MAG: cupin domain-containing protein [Candidatus Promineofilum sp.]|nr:cupin domain-containing protein [Promineifilum sp.]
MAALGRGHARPGHGTARRRGHGRRSHGDRRALIYVVEGSVTEYASNCAVPIVHKAGEVSVETKQVSHWWKNTGDEPVVLISADLLQSGKMDDHMM